MRHKWIDGVYCLKKIPESVDQFGNVSPAQYLLDSINVKVDGDSFEMSYEMTIDRFDGRVTRFLFTEPIHLERKEKDV